MEISRIRMHVEDAGGPREHVVVDAAPLASMVTELMIDLWRDGVAPHIEVKGDRVTFGTPGEGVGVVTYAIGPSIPRSELPISRRVEGHGYRLLGRVA